MVGSVVGRAVERKKKKKKINNVGVGDLAWWPESKRLEVCFYICELGI